MEAFSFNSWILHAQKKGRFLIRTISDKGAS
jgi:hypothetical protein